MAKKIIFNPLSCSFDIISEVALAAVGSSPNSSSASISGQTLTLQPADATNPGIISTGNQTLPGNKTFSGTVAASNLSGTNTGDQTITLTGAVTGSGTGSIVTTYSQQTADDIANVPSGNLAATNVQSGLNELQGDIDTLTSNTSTIAASYYGASATAISSGTITYLDFPTITGDTNSAVLGAGSGNVITSGTGWRFIVPATGWYNVAVCITSQSQIQTTTQYLIPVLAVNGTLVRILGGIIGNGSINYYRMSASTLYPLTAGNRVEIAFVQNVGSITLYNGIDTSVSINRV